MAQIKLVRTDDFTGGLNLRADPFQLGESESPDMLNVDVDPRGGFAMRSGFARLNTTAIGSVADGSFAPEKVFSWERSTPQLLTAANSKVFYSTDGVTHTDTTIATSSTEGASFAAWSSASAAVVYVACGRASSTMAKWDGAADTALTASGTGQWQDSFASPSGTHMPRCDHAAVHVDRLWVASTYEDGANFKNRVRFSHPLFPESWREVDYIDIPGGGDGITAIVPWGDALLVFKKLAIYALYGYDTDSFQLVKLTGTIGAETSHCVCPTEHGLYLFSWPEGVYLWDGNGFKDVFARIRPVIQDGLVNAAYLNRVWLSYADNRVWLSLPLDSDTRPTVTFVFDPTVNSWTKYQLSDDTGLACLTDFTLSSGVSKTVGLHSANAFLLEQVEGSVVDDLLGTPTGFDSHYLTRWIDGGIISAKKMWRQPDFVVQQPDTDLLLTISVYRDWEEANARRIYTLTVSGAGAGLVWGVGDWGDLWGAGASGSQHERGQRLGLARSVQLKIQGPGARKWGVNSITYKYNQRRVR